MAAARAPGREDHDAVLAGNLCRCTGYATIVRSIQWAAKKEQETTPVEVSAS